MNFGTDWRIFFFRPLFEAAFDDTVEARRSHAQRATAMRPTTQIKAQSKAARMTTKSDSTATASGGCAAVVDGDEDELTVLRNLVGRVMMSHIRDGQREREDRWGRGVVLRRCFQTVKTDS